ncbi:hypothetical protein [Rhodospirillum sp. A1_3_36]|uniref:hypothetical protein n=1 Tax=Rhodospirillum sp. A1_3_36 TaxID=3391666 RepID=UPI0039A632EC
MNDDAKSIILNCGGKLYYIPENLWTATELPEDLRGEAHSLAASGMMLLVGPGNRSNTAFVNLDCIDFEDTDAVDV